MIKELKERLNALTKENARLIEEMECYNARREDSIAKYEKLRLRYQQLEIENQKLWETINKQEME